MTYEAWAVIACDQFTSQPEYWSKVKKIAGNRPSTYHMIIPEVMLPGGRERISQINATMNDYLTRNIFIEYSNVYIYIERTLLDGSIRSGIIGAIDLEEYDYRPGSRSRIRATELTVEERIPPRKAVRENSPLELPHVILLCDDERRELIEPLKFSKRGMQEIYDFDLMLGGGHITGWLLTGEQMRAFNMRMDNYIKRKARELSVTFTVGDGNHSLAAAKMYYEQRKDTNPLARYALVELENIHDSAIKFEPIHRFVKGVQPEDFIASLRKDICVSVLGEYWPIRYHSQWKTDTLYIDKSKGASPLIVLQNYLDAKGCNVDYIHDVDSLISLSGEEGCVGFEMPQFDAKAKQDFFRIISKSGVLPQKTFSMGHAREKRYYLEARRIR